MGRARPSLQRDGPPGAGAPVAAQGRDVNLGTRLLDVGKPHEAIPHLEEAARLRPQDAPPIGVLGFARYQVRQFPAAAECLEAALRIDPENAEAWFCLGVSLDEAGRHKGAVNAFETAVFMTPDHGLGWARLGKALRALGRHAEAVNSYEKSIAKGFSPAPVWLDMGRSAAAVGDGACVERARRRLRSLDSAGAGELTRLLRRLKTEARRLKDPSAAAA